MDQQATPKKTTEDRRPKTGQPSPVSGHEEEIFGKAYDLQLIRRLWRFIVPYRKLFWLAMLVLPLQQLFALAQPYIMKVAIDSYIAGAQLWGLQGMVLFFLFSLLELVCHTPSAPCEIFFPPGSFFPTCTILLSFVFYTIF